MRARLLVLLIAIGCSSSKPSTVSVGSGSHAGTDGGSSGGAGTSSSKASGQARYDGGSGPVTLDAAAQSKGDASASSVPSGGFMLSANLTDAVSGDVLAGAKVCLIDAPSTCTTVDANGDFTISGIGAKRSGIVASLTGYVTGIWPIAPTGDVDGWTIFLRKDARVTALASEIGTTFSSSSGAIVFAAKDSSGTPLAGVTVALNGGGKVGYFTADGTKLDPALTATSSHGQGFVFDLAPGDVRVTFALPGKTCVKNGAEGWPASGSETMTVPIQAGKLSRAAAVCE